MHWDSESTLISRKWWVIKLGLFEIIITCLAWPTVQMVEFQVNRREGKVKICTDQSRIIK